MANITTLDQLKIVSRSTGFSGVDIHPLLILPAVKNRAGTELSSAKTFSLGSIQTLSYSIYSSKEPVRSLGFKLPINYARGNKTIAGTIIFNQLNKHVFDDKGFATVIRDEYGVLSHSSGRAEIVTQRLPDNLPLEAAGFSGLVNYKVVNKRHLVDWSWDIKRFTSLLHATDLPPFDIVCLFVNELGNIGKLILYGVELVHESSTLSIEDIYTEVVYQFVARDMESFQSTDFDQTREWRSTIIGVNDVGPSSVQAGINGAIDQGLLAQLNNEMVKERQSEFERISAINRQNSIVDASNQVEFAQYAVTEALRQARENSEWSDSVRRRRRSDGLNSLDNAILLSQFGVGNALRNATGRNLDREYIYESNRPRTERDLDNAIFAAASQINNARFEGGASTVGLNYRGNSEGESTIIDEPKGDLPRRR